MMVAQVW